MKKLRKVKNVFEVSQVEYDKLYSQNKVDDNDLYIIKDKVKTVQKKCKHTLLTNVVVFIATFIVTLSIWLLGYSTGYDKAIRIDCPQAFEEMALTQEEL